MVKQERWREAAACAGLGPEVFFAPDIDDSPEAAKAICEKCTVNKECLEFAITNRQGEGVWGGFTPLERRRLIRQRRRRSA